MTTSTSRASLHQQVPILLTTTSSVKQETPTLNSLLQKPVVVGGAGSAVSSTNPVPSNSNGGAGLQQHHNLAYSAPTPPFGVTSATSATPPATNDIMTGAATPVPPPPPEQRWPTFVGRFQNPIDMMKQSADFSAAKALGLAIPQAIMPTSPFQTLPLRPYPTSAVSGLPNPAALYMYPGHMPSYMASLPATTSSLCSANAAQAAALKSVYNIETMTNDFETKPSRQLLTTMSGGVPSPAMFSGGGSLLNVKQHPAVAALRQENQAPPSGDAASSGSSHTIIVNGSRSTTGSPQIHHPHPVTSRGESRSPARNVVQSGSTNVQHMRHSPVSPAASSTPNANIGPFHAPGSHFNTGPPQPNFNPAAQAQYYQNPAAAYSNGTPQQAAFAAAAMARFRAASGARLPTTLSNAAPPYANNGKPLNGLSQTTFAPPNSAMEDMKLSIEKINGRNTPSVASSESRLTATPECAGKQTKHATGAKDSHPSTPAINSTGDDSASDVDEDLESSLSSPSWPRTPMSPANSTRHSGSMASTSSHHHHHARMNGMSSLGAAPLPGFMGAAMMPMPAPLPQPSGQFSPHQRPGGGAPSSLFDKLIACEYRPTPGVNPALEWEERRRFLDHYAHYCENIGNIQMTGHPSVSKQHLDLFILYRFVKQNGGYYKCTKNKTWRLMCEMFNVNQSNSASGQIKKQYAKYLLPYECYYDLNKADIEPILRACESKKKIRSKPGNSQSASGLPILGHPNLPPYTPGVQQPMMMDGSGPPPPGYFYNSPQPGLPGIRPNPETPRGRVKQPRRSRANNGASTNQSGDVEAAINPFDDSALANNNKRPVGPFSPALAAAQQQRSTATPPARYPREQPLYARPPHFGGYGGPPIDNNGPMIVDSNNQSQQSGYPVRPAHHPFFNQSPNSAPPQLQPQQQVAVPPPAPMDQSASRYYGQDGATAQGSQQAQQQQSSEPPAFSPTGPPVLSAAVPAPPISAEKPPRPMMTTQQYYNCRAFAAGPQPQQVANCAYPYNSMNTAYCRMPADMALRVQVSRMNNNAMPPVLSPRKDIPLPSPVNTTCVEATTFKGVKRRRVHAKDLEKMDLWRLVMALKSGLTFETSWALNVLTVLLYDDSTIGYFDLTNMPGLFNVLLNVLRCNLSKFHYWINFTTNSMKTDSNPKLKPMEVDQKMTEAKIWPKNEETPQELQPELLYRGDWLLTEAPTNPEARRHLDICLCVTNVLRGILALPDNEILIGRQLKYAAPLLGLLVELLDIGKLLSHRKDNYENSNSDVAKLFGGQLKTGSNNDNYCKQSTQLYKQSGSTTITTTTMPKKECETFDEKFGPERIDEILRQNELEEQKTRKESGKLPLTNPAPNVSDKPVRLSTPFAWCQRDARHLRDDALVILCHVSPYLQLIEHDGERVERLFAEVTRLALDDQAMTHNADLVDASVAKMMISAAGKMVLNEKKGPAADPPPARCALESLCKLTVNDSNVDLWLNSRPRSNVNHLLRRLCSYLAPSFATVPNHVMSSSGGLDALLREFALVLLHAACRADPVACHVVGAQQVDGVERLVSFLENADLEMQRVLQTHGVATLRDNPEIIGTSVGMLRRAASTLVCLAKVGACRRKFTPLQVARLISITTSHLMDTRVGHTAAEILFELQKRVDFAS